MTQWSVTVVRGADALPEPALRLLEQREQANFEFGHIWYRNLIGTVFGQDPTVRFYLLWREQEVAAILPLHAERTLLGWKVRALSNFYTTLYEPALAHGVAAEQLALLLQQVKRDFRGLASLTLNPLDQSAPAYPVLRRAMSLAPSGVAITVRLHPEDHDTLVGTDTDAAHPGGEFILGGRPIRVIADASLSPGDAMADYAATTIDASLTTAMARVREVLSA